jgi:hypothetical protein
MTDTIPFRRFCPYPILIPMQLKEVAQELLKNRRHPGLVVEHLLESRRSTVLVWHQLASFSIFCPFLSR